MEKLKYTVTEKAGPWVAGFRSPADGILSLTGRQAAYELILGTIEPFKESAPAAAEAEPAPKAKSKG